MRAFSPTSALVRVAVVILATVASGCTPVFDCASYAGLQPVGLHTPACTLASAQASIPAR